MTSTAETECECNHAECPGDCATACPQCWESWNAKRMEKRDDAAGLLLRDVLRELLSRAVILEEEACGLRSEAARIEKAVAAGKWYRLRGILPEEMIESFYECGPSTEEGRKELLR